MRPPATPPQPLQIKNHKRTGSAGARSVMSGYDMITSVFGHDGQQGVATRQHVGGFQPNAGLSKPITPSFIRDYNSGAVPPVRVRGASEQLRRSATREMSPDAEGRSATREMSPDADGCEDSSRIFGGSLVMSHTYGSDGTATSQSGDMLRMSEISRQRQQMGWNYGG